MTQINKMAFSIGNDDIDLYLTAMKASEILQVATVSRVDEDAQKGYQRHLSEPRAKLIGGIFRFRESNPRGRNSECSRKLSYIIQ
uniref:hypothetical protein n=1 Tax=Providencia sp. PROV061 TaxID=2936777 RepID=UPI00402B7545